MGPQAFFKIENSYVSWPDPGVESINASQRQEGALSLEATQEHPPYLLKEEIIEDVLLSTA